MLILINIAATDLILLLGKQEDIEEGYVYDTSKIEAFLVSKGTMIEVFATTLHYASCNSNGNEFKCVVVLPKDTNTDLETIVAKKNEDALLFAKNKWLIAHEDAYIENAFVGLKEQDMVEDVRTLKSTGGRKAVTLKLKDNCRYIIGVALTPRHIKLILVNLRNKIVDNIRIRHYSSDIDEMMDIAIDNINELLRKYNIGLNILLGIGISIPGTVNTETGVIKKCYLLNANGYNIKDKLKMLRVPIYIENEANLSAYYAYLEKGQSTSNLLYVSITAGLGAGIIIDGNIHRGSNHSAGEFGHTKIYIGGKKCKCGDYGCLEAYASKNALFEEYNQKAGTNIEEIEEFEKVYKNNDPLALEVFEEYIKVLSKGIANLVLLFDPKAIVIGGEMNSILQNQVSKLQENIYKNNIFTDENSCKIETAREKESYLLGAASLVIDKALQVS